MNRHHVLVGGLILVLCTLLASKDRWFLENTKKGQRLVRWFGPVSAIWVLRGFFQTIPHELEDAASVDGASRIRTLISIILPLSQPALAAVSLLVFLNAWNEFVIASIMISSSLLRTAQVFLYQTMGEVGVSHRS